MADFGSRFSFRPEQTTLYIRVAFGVAVLALVAVVFILKFLFAPEAASPVDSLAQTAPPAILYPVPKNRDILMDTVPAPAPVADAAPEKIPVTAAAPKVTEGKVLLQLGAKLAGTLTLSSPSVQNGRLSIEHTCYRRNISPPLNWTGIPPGTKTLVLFFEKDEAGPDNPAQWLVYNISPKSSGLAGQIPVGTALADGSMQGVGEGGRVGYTGPCVPKGQHMYQFRLFALDTVPNLPMGAHKYDIIQMMNGHVIDMAVYPVMHFYKL